MSRKCGSCGEPGANVAAFCGRCGARELSSVARKPRRADRGRARGTRPALPRPSWGRLVGIATVLAVVATLAAGLEFDERVGGDVRMPVAAPTAGEGPRVLAAPAPSPALAPCERPGATELCIRWRRPRAHDQPVLADGPTVFLAQSGGAVAALDRASGDVRWSTPGTVGPIVDGAASPAALTLVGAGGGPSGDGLAGLDPEDGSLAWTAPADGPSVDVHLASGAVLVLEPGRLRRLDAASGVERWERPTRDPAGVQLISTTDEVTFVSSERTVTALDNADGDARWAVPVPGLRTAAVADPGSLVALDGEGRMLGLDTSEGTVRWDTRLAYNSRSAVRVYGVPGTVIAAIDPPVADDGSRTSRIVGIDPATGAVRWVHLYRSTVDRRGIVLTPDVALLVGTSRPGAVAALDLRTGGMAWQHDLGDDPAHARPVDGRVLVASGRDVALLSQTDGSVVASARSGSPVIGIVAADPGSAVLKTTTGLVVVSLPTSG